MRPVVNCFYEMLDEHHGKRGADILEMFTNDYLRSVIDEYVSIDVFFYENQKRSVLHNLAGCFSGEKSGLMYRFHVKPGS